MSFVFIGDSHCRDLARSFQLNFPLHRYHKIKVGGQMDAIMDQYRMEIATINRLHPKYIIIHMGHNNIVQHPIYNRSPEMAKQVAEENIEFANEIRLNHPYAIIYVSTIFPRTHTPSSSITLPDVKEYNKIAKRHGKRIRSLAKAAGLNSFINNTSWHKISAAIENTTLFQADGLHLSPSGCKKILIEWMSILNLYTPDEQ
jgi:lysophospholipase L1-like esterase